MVFFLTPVHIGVARLVSPIENVHVISKDTIKLLCERARQVSEHIT